MRLNRQQEKVATTELLQMLKDEPAGLRTSEMAGTRNFHGARTLGRRQIARLLRATEKVREYCGGQGMRTFTLWQLK